MKVYTAKIYIGVLFNGNTWPSVYMKMQKSLKSEISGSFTLLKLKHIRYLYKPSVWS